MKRTLRNLLWEFTGSDWRFRLNPALRASELSPKLQAYFGFDY